MGSPELAAQPGTPHREPAGSIRFQPEENPDWDGARNRRLALRTPGAEWCQSSLTVRTEEGFYRHRTDFAYEGLLSLVKGENWKFLDGIGFRLRDPEGGLMELVPCELLATPEEVTYTFAGADGVLSIRYMLLELVPHCTPGSEPWTALACRYGWSGSPAVLELLPVVDIRHMYYFSDPAGHRTERPGPRQLLLGGGRFLALRAGADFTWEPLARVVELSYPLGSGNREVAGGVARFQREHFRGFLPGMLAFHLEVGQSIDLHVAAGSDAATATSSAEQAGRDAGKLAGDQRARLDLTIERYGMLPPAAALRIYVMAHKFGICWDGQVVPEAGGWWFRAPDFRNLFEGLLHNRRALLAEGRGDRLDTALRLGFRTLVTEGGLPLRVPDGHRAPGANQQPATDAPLLLGSLFAAHLEEIQDQDMLRLAAEGLSRLITTFQEAEPGRLRGGPVLGRDGLLLTLPGYSWTNGRRTLRVEGMAVGDLPLRVDRQWQIEDILRLRDGHYAWERYQLPRFLLPEVNAHWLLTLEGAIRLHRRLGDEAAEAEIQGRYLLALGNYKRIFWNHGTGYLYNLVTEDGRTDPMLGSPAMEAAALLGTRVFTVGDLQQIWQRVQEHLLVRRDHEARSLPFGVLVKDSEDRVFLGDEQYHEAVIWPREGAYLARLLRLLAGQAGDGALPRQARTALEDLLAAQLDHQMDEGVVFYVHEILSLPEGGNPHAVPGTCRQPVPVKNPMQWWSQWCDPFLEGLATASGV